MPSPIVTSKNGDNSPRDLNRSPPGDKLSDSKQDNSSVKVEVPPSISQPLAPPPVPARTTTADYFGTAHNSLTSELNPFEHQFAGGPSASGDIRTPGGTKLPSVAALASPAGPFFGNSTPGGFFSSLRSGPLSPAMLSAPKAQEDYFSEQHSMRSGFTPNESGLRSGLTPGGGGSMFPEPSPGTTAMFQSLQSGGVTPASLEFQRTALNIANKTREAAAQQNVTSQPQEMVNLNGTRDAKVPFDETNDAANGLFMLARQSSQRNNVPPPQPNHYTLAPQPIPIQHPHTQPAIHIPGSQANNSQHLKQNVQAPSVSASTRRGSVASNAFSDENNTQTKPNTRGKKRNQANGQGKGKAASNKKSKANGGHARSTSMDSLQEPPSPEDMKEMDGKDEYNAQGKKLTDEEKRKNFLERNRIAALKCRQRKKQWLSNLQAKCEMYAQENEGLHQEVAALKMERQTYMNLLAAHKDCPIGIQQGLSSLLPGFPQQRGPGMNGYDGHQMNLQNPYGMAQPDGLHPQAMQSQAVQSQAMQSQAMQ